MKKLPPLNAVRAFEAAARHVSFTKAAAELCVTHGAVSRHVATLEGWLGVRLFQRNASHLTLTAAGWSYLRDVSVALERLESSSMYLMQRLAPSVLRVNAAHAFAMRWLMGRISAFNRKHPEIELRLSTSDSPADFRVDNYDVAIRTSVGPAHECNVAAVMPDVLAPVCHVDLLDSTPSRTVADLAGLTLISYGAAPVSWDDWIAVEETGGVRAGGTLHFESMCLALQAAREGLGIALIPLGLVADELVAGQMCVPFGKRGLRQLGWDAYFTGGAGTCPVVGAFVEWLATEGRDTKRLLDEWASEKGWALDRTVETLLQEQS
ncbi:MAG TPA: LysR substrate-binding domain-containing protein [Ramlibacter sp.]|uniref:LysR substrate-binding domain-containing protein n=1 Tax=Ramlibacter sp. TaxID=1917967 RepID=UPI002B8D6153|nr:LysR substrate-binding domain-containing protein [Ramlibacter sp.]HVZ45802.1 LysR substrate-binding domain-containing protein [Ramlibacter sp.]